MLIYFCFSVILISQSFGLLPLSGIRSKNPQDINFQWNSFRSLFSLFFILYDVYALKVVTQIEFGKGINSRNASGIFFFGNCILINILLLRVASDWKCIMIKWMNLETLFTKDRYTTDPQSWSMQKKIKVFAIVFLFFALLENLLSISTESKNGNSIKVYHLTLISFFC